MFHSYVSLPEGNENTDAVFCCLFFLCFYECVFNISGRLIQNKKKLDVETKSSGPRFFLNVVAKNSPLENARGRNRSTYQPPTVISRWLILDAERPSPRKKYPVYLNQISANAMC